MPIIKSAIKKMKQDKEKEARNKKYDHEYKKQVRLVKKGKVTSTVDAFSAVDKAAKKKVIHKKKASRLKALVSKLTRPSSKKK
jgi:ribosomal protein S20